jgi:hypothetical protein
MDFLRSVSNQNYHCFPLNLVRYECVNDAIHMDTHNKYKCAHNAMFIDGQE